MKFDVINCVVKHLWVWTNFEDDRCIDRSIGDPGKQSSRVFVIGVVTPISYFHTTEPHNLCCQKWCTLYVLKICNMGGLISQNHLFWPKKVS